MPTVALTGGAYQARSLIASAQRAVNLYAEPMPEAQGEPGKAAHYPTPGIRFLSTIGPGPIRGIRRATTGALFVVSGNGVYVVDTNTWAGTHLGDITYGLRTPVGMADNGLDMVIVDGTAGGWHITLAGNAFAAITDVGGMFSGADRVDFLDTYLLFNKPNTPQFYSSDSLALTFDPLWFANKEAYSDLLRTLVVVKRDIWLLGEMSTEVWANVGKEDFPFESQPDVFIDHGIAAKYSVANYDNALFWLCNDRQGHGFVIQGAGYQTKRISTYAIEAEIARYPRVDDAIGFTYLLAGHAFYVIAFPAADKTWSYDITTGHWHEWVWIDANGAEHRHRANCCWPVDGVPIVGDWQNGNIYALDLKQFTDNGQPIKRLRSFPHGLNEGKRLFFRQFIADLETGWTPPADVVTASTILDATFSAADGTSMASYTSDVGGGWTLADGTGLAMIEAGRMTGLGGASSWRSAVAPATADYDVRFNVVPSGYGGVPTGSLWAVGRAGSGTGYRVTVTADGSHYTLTLDVLPSGASLSVAMGTLASGAYTVWLRMAGHDIIAQAQRSRDGLWLRDDGAWQSDPGTAAAHLTDATHTAPGAIQVGGIWS